MTFRLAHISDLHLTGDEDEREQLEGLFSSFVEYEIDHVLVTGDVSEDGDADAFRMLDEVRREYGFGPRRSTVLIGNHDVPGKPTFSRRFGGEYVTIRSLDGGNLRLVGLDSAGVNGGAGPLCHNPMGWLEPFQFDALEQALSGGSPARTVVALHHHVVNVPDGDMLMSAGEAVGLWGPLEDAADLLDLLGRYGVPLVLTGHSHVERTKTVERHQTAIRCQIGGATLDCESGYRFLDFEGGVLVDEGWVELCEACGETKTVRCESCDDDCEVECEDCEGSGYVGCPECDDDGNIACDTCEGDGGVECGYCRGEGCGHCDESGVRECRDCDGDGEVGCDACDDDAEIECEACEGTGHVTCGECEGEGEVECPECE